MEVGFIGRHRSVAMLSPLHSVCVLRLGGRVVFFSFMHTLHAMWELLSLRPRESGSSSLPRDNNASVSGWA